MAAPPGRGRLRVSFPGPGKDRGATVNPDTERGKSRSRPAIGSRRGKGLDDLDPEREDRVALIPLGEEDQHVPAGLEVELRPT
jgi:hypothetical protein